MTVSTVLEKNSFYLLGEEKGTVKSRVGFAWSNGKHLDLEYSLMF